MGEIGKVDDVVDVVSRIEVRVRCYFTLGLPFRYGP